MSYTNSPPKYKTTLKPKTTPPFLSQMTKGKSLRGRHLVITGRVNITLIIIRRGLWRRRGRRSKAANASLLVFNVSYPNVHLTHLINVIVETTTKISMHPL